LPPSIGKNGRVRPGSIYDMSTQREEGSLAERTILRPCMGFCMFEE